MSSIWQFPIELFIGAAICVIAFCVWLIKVVFLGIWAIFFIIVFIIQLLFQQERAILNMALGFG